MPKNKHGLPLMVKLSPDSYTGMMMSYPKQMSYPKMKYKRDKDMGMKKEAMHHGWYKMVYDAKMDLYKKYGEPTYEVKGKLCVWEKKIGKIDTTMIKNEMIPHHFPKHHYDFLYGTFYFDVPLPIVSILAGVTPSIMCDRLKGEVTVRCGGMVPNAISVQFVIDLVNGGIDPDYAKDEYATRIKSMKPPEWFK